MCKLWSDYPKFCGRMDFKFSRGFNRTEIDNDIRPQRTVCVCVCVPPPPRELVEGRHR